MTNGPIFDTITSDLQSIGTTGTNQDTVGMSSACTQLGLDVTTARGFSPIPDPTAQGEWASLLTTLASASQDCVNGVAQSNSGLLQQSAHELDTSTTEINALSHTLGLS
jgi:hypothetical protein